jgi:hypothetical protein
LARGIAGRLPAFEVSFETESSLKVSVSTPNAPAVIPEGSRRLRRPGRTGEGEPVFATNSSACRKSGAVSVCSWCRSARGSEAGKGRKVSFEIESSLKVSGLNANAPEVRDGFAAPRRAGEGDRVPCRSAGRSALRVG